MSEEQKKVRRFYKEFISWRPESIGSWVGAGLSAMFLLIGCAIPAQDIFHNIATDGMAMLWITMISGVLAGVLYLRPYQRYTENQKTETILSKLKYLPIDFKEIRKMKVIYLLKFYAKIAPFCLLLQALTSWHSYGEVTWMNTGYVVAAAFVWPVLANLGDALSGK